MGEYPADICGCLHLADLPFAGNIQTPAELQHWRGLQAQMPWQGAPTGVLRAVVLSIILQAVQPCSVHIFSMVHSRRMPLSGAASGHDGVSHGLKRTPIAQHRKPNNSS